MQKGYITQTEYENQKKLAINEQYELSLTEFELQSMSYNELIEYKELSVSLYHRNQELRALALEYEHKLEEFRQKDEEILKIKDRLSEMRFIHERV